MKQNSSSNNNFCFDFQFHIVMCRYPIDDLFKIQFHKSQARFVRFQPNPRLLDIFLQITLNPVHFN
jgi:hypothetical protein